MVDTNKQDEPEVADSGQPYSSRIERMIHQRSQSLSSGIDFDTEFSKEHWAELIPTTALTNEVHMDLDDTTDGVFKAMDFVVGRVLAEGAQGKVCKAYVGNNNAPFVVKVFKANSVDAVRSSLHANLFRCSHPAVCRVIKGAMLGSNEYGILMEMHLRDLRKAMDVIMEKSSNRSPPFKEPEALFYMLTIASGVRYLHSIGILHQDLKAANVLVRHPLPGDYQSEGYPPAGVFRCAVADYECSAGILGTGFWRAVEILQFSNNRSCLAAGSAAELQFTTKMDVYSYGVTCYEILTGFMPFEEYEAVSFDRVIGGLRSTLPRRLSSGVRALVSRCWQRDPEKRPEFSEIVEVLVKMVTKLGFKKEDVVGYHYRGPVSTSQLVARRLGKVSTPASRYVTIDE